MLSQRTRAAHEVPKRDRWKRLIGVVRLADEDMNLHMVDRGLTWHYKQ